MALLQHRRGREPPLLHVTRDGKRPDANGDDATDHRQSTPERNLRHPVTHEIREKMPAQEREHCDENKTGIDRAAEQMHAG
jgi:hypothetical protein